MGELIKPITQNYQSSGRGTLKQPPLPDGISRKQSHYAQTLADNIDTIEEVIEEAKEKEDIPTWTQVLQKINRERKKLILKILYFKKIHL